MPTRSSDGPIRSPRRRLACGGEELEVLPPGQMAVEPGLVDDGPDPGQGLVAMTGNGVSEQRHRAGVGVGQSEQHPDERGLARPVRAQVAERASPGDEELHAVHGDVVPEPLGQPVGLDGPLALRGPRVGGDRKRRRGHLASFSVGDPTLSSSCEATGVSPVDEVRPQERGVE